VAGRGVGYALTVMSVRTVFVLPSLAGGGAERVILTLVRRLDRARIEPILITLSGSGPLAALVPDDMRWIDLARPRLRRALPALVATLRRERPAAIVSTLGYVNIALLVLRPLFKGRPRLILREANLPTKSAAATRWPWLMRMAYGRLYPKADAVLANSTPTLDELRLLGGVRPERLVLLPNPIDVGVVRAKAMKLERVAGEGARFVAAGRLTAQKGFDRLIQAMTSLPPSAQLTIFGEGPDEPKLRKRIAALGLDRRVVLGGFVANPWAHYAGADAFLLSSHWEGQANAALEALAVGTPVVATPEAGGIAEVAASAAPAAVTIAAAGEEFNAALRGVSPNPPSAPRPSLLPAGFEPDAIAEQLVQVIEGRLP
jgi:glycosyltransferase involved in cell wall biosynthesis